MEKPLYKMVGHNYMKEFEDKLNRAVTEGYMISEYQPSGSYSYKYAILLILKSEEEKQKKGFE